MARARLFALLLPTCTAVACGGGESRAVPPPAPPASSSALAASAPAATTSAQVVQVTAADQPQATPEVMRAPVYVIARIKGRSTDELGRMFEPTQERVQQCVAGPTGVVRVRIESKGDTTLLTVEPDPKLTDPQRRCILEALSTMELENGDASKRLGPEGWTSHVVISW